MKKETKQQKLIKTSNAYAKEMWELHLKWGEDRIKNYMFASCPNWGGKGHNREAFETVYNELKLNGHIGAIKELFCVLAINEYLKGVKEAA